MAKQIGDMKMVGSIDGLCFYQLDGQYYARTQSSLTSKRFWKDKAFCGSRKSCSRFGEGNKLASKLYNTVEKEKRVYPLFCFLKSKAIALLKQGMSLPQAEQVLTDYLLSFDLLEPKPSKPIICSTAEPHLAANISVGSYCKHSNAAMKAFVNTSQIQEATHINTAFSTQRRHYICTSNYL